MSIIKQNFAGPKGPLLVLVAGPPAAGKSTLADRLAADLGLPLLAKDAVKETLADHLRVDTLEQSRQLGRAVVALLYSLTGQMLGAGVGLVLECAFHREAAQRDLPPLLAAAEPVLLHCTLPPTEAARRYRERHRRGERHPCHLDDGRDPIDWDRYDVMDLGVPTLLVDTTDGYRPGYPQIRAFVEAHRPPPPVHGEPAGSR